jgi:hypothetical protein
VGREFVLALTAIVILIAALGIAIAYPSHAYQTAAPTSPIHTYCMTVVSFEAVPAPWRVERWWQLRIGALGVGTTLALGLLAARRVSFTRRTRSAPA